MDVLEQETLKALRLEKSKRRLLEFGQRVYAGWQSPKHIEYLAHKLEQVEQGKIKRLCISAPPGHGKSTLLQVSLAYAIGRNPYRRILALSASEALARRNSRAVREIVRSDEWPWPKVTLVGEALDEWQTNEGGGVRAIGQTGTVTGFRAEMILCDDVQPDAGSELTRETIEEWFRGVLTTRLEPTGAAVIINCLTGDTPVTMGDGSYKELKDIRPGDFVLAYNNGLAESKEVLNWANQGVDDIFEIRTGSSRIRGNGRHPILTEDKDGFRKWITIDCIQKGDRIVTSSKIPLFRSKLLSEKEAWLLGYMFGDGWITERDTTQTDKNGRTYPRKGLVTCVALSAYPEENQMVSDLFFDIFGKRPKQTEYGYCRTEIQDIGKWFKARGLIGKAKTKRLPEYLYCEPEYVRAAFLDGFNSADGHIVMSGRNEGRWVLGVSNEPLIRDIRHLARGIGYKVSNIHVQYFIAQPPGSPKPVHGMTANVQWNPERTSRSFVTSTVRSKIPVGKAEVFDIQVADAGTFLADGVVVSNTRWHDADLIGRLQEGASADEWEFINLPAICVDNDDPLNREIGDALWPERWPVEELDKVRLAVGPGQFDAQYQGDPTPAGGAIFKPEWFENRYEIVPQYCQIETIVPKRDQFDEILLGPIQVRKTDPMPCPKIMACDSAWKDGARNDFSAIVTAVSDLRDIYITNLWYGQVDYMTLQRLLVEFYNLERPRTLYVEEASSGYALIPELRRATDIPIVGVPPGNDSKEAKAEASTGWWEAGRVKLPKYAPWMPRLIQEHLRFPRGRHDDVVDAVRICVMKMIETISRLSTERKFNRQLSGVGAWMER